MHVDGKLQKLDKILILMCKEGSTGTRPAILNSLNQATIARLDARIELLSG
jgi:hypothetical protein